MEYIPTGERTVLFPVLFSPTKKLTAPKGIKVLEKPLKLFKNKIIVMIWIIIIYPPKNGLREPAANIPLQ